MVCRFRRPSEQKGRCYVKIPSKGGYAASVTVGLASDHQGRRPLVSDPGYDGQEKDCRHRSVTQHDDEFLSRTIWWRRNRACVNNRPRHDYLPVRPACNIPILSECRKPLREEQVYQHHHLPGPGRTRGTCQSEKTKSISVGSMATDRACSGCPSISGDNCNAVTASSGNSRGSSYVAG